LPFRFDEGASAAALLAKLAARNWWGQIVGPHGSGKTSLLATLAPLLQAAGRRVEVVDGYEELSRVARWRLRQRCLRSRSGLLVTSHRSMGLPTLIELAPDRALVEQLVAELCQRVCATGSASALPSGEQTHSQSQWHTPITPADVDASHARHGRNVREILFDLYDRHEQIIRQGVNRRDASDVAIVGSVLP
jgi:energy-coupling factor transporter ATP-binding protein EcfA2